jgi:putative MFS transporter
MWQLPGPGVGAQDFMTDNTRDSEPARLLWLQPSFLRPPSPITRRQERVFLLVGLAALFAGYNESVFAFAVPQIQSSLHIAEDKVGTTLTMFRLAVFGAMAFSMLADVVGRRRLLLITIMGQAFATLGSAFAQEYSFFVAFQMAVRVFSYAELTLCFVVIIEEMSAPTRGWSVGALAAMNNIGGGIVSLVFAFVTLLPYGWRSLYAIGAIPLFIVAFLRRRLPETQRFEIRADEIRNLTSHVAVTLDLIRRLATEYPGRVLATLVAGFCWSAAVAPAGALGLKYMQQTLGFAPWQTTLIVVPGGMFAVWLNVIAGRLSDRVGRKRVICASALLTAITYAFFYSGVRGNFMGPFWAICFFFGLTTDTLYSGISAEIFPTAYRATIGAIGTTISALGAALSLYFEGLLYDFFGGHGPAVSVPLAGVLLTIAAIAFLPEPAGRVLEEISDAGPSPAAALSTEQTSQ